MVGLLLLWGGVAGPTAQAQELGFVQVIEDDTFVVEGLGGADAVAVSPDGKHAYATGSNAVVVFSRNTMTGRLTFVEAHFDDAGGVDGLGGADAVAVSPDGKHVYATGSSDDAVAVFSRNATTGALTFVEATFDSDIGVDGLDGARSVTVSPDGAHVYVASHRDDAVTVFGRNATTGALTFIERHTDNAGFVDGLETAWSVTISPDGAHVYAVGHFDHAVAVFSRNAATGKLTFVEAIFDDVDGVDGLFEPRSVTVSPDGDHVYVASREDAVSIFSRNAGTGELTFIEAIFDGEGDISGLFRPAAVTVSPDGDHVYVTATFSNALVVFSRDAATGLLTFVEVKRDDVGGVDGLAWPLSVTVSPDGDHVYATSLNDGAVAVFSRNAGTGRLTFVEVQRNGVGIDGLDGAFSVAVSPDGDHVYTAGAFDDAVAVFFRNATTGKLAFVEVHEDGVDGVDGLKAASSVAVSPDARHVYAAGFSDDAVAVFSRNTTTGRLTFEEVHEDGVDGVDGLQGAHAVTVSPDGKHVYAASQFDDAVAVFSRHAGTGRLTFVEALVDGAGGVDGLDVASSVTVSPDGAHVYAAGFADNAVAVFSRNAETGALLFVEVEQDGAAGVDGLTGAYAVTVSPDGKHVYAAGLNDNAVAVFSRNAANGKLAFVEALFDGIDGVDGLLGAHAVTVNPDGRHVYAAGRFDNAVAVFLRNTVTGQLAFVQRRKDDAGGVDGLDEAVSVTVSPDGEHIYTAGFSDDAVAAFRRLGLGPVVRYVAPTGSDTNNDCTQAATSCATIAHAISQADAGDVLYLAAGTYLESGLVIDNRLIIQGQGVTVR